MALKDFMVKSNVQMMGHNTIGGYLAGPSTFVIDPAAIGDDTGLVQIKGGLQVDGTTTTVNSTTLDVADLNITVAKGATNAGAADGAGLTVDGANATLIYRSTGDKWIFNKAPFYNSDALLVASDLSIATDATPAGDGGISYDPSTKQFTYTPAVLSGLTGTTDDITEGTTNLYFTNQRADTRATLRITAADIGNLNNVDETGVANNKILKYNSTSSKWEVADDSGIALTDLSVTTGSASGSGTLTYNNSTGVFSFAPADLSTYLTSETDTLDSVTGRGATTTNDISVNKLTATVATGTAPFVVSSTTKVSNLNADKLDDKEFTDIIAEATALAIALGQNMAQTFKNYTAGSIGTTPTTVYTVASATTSILIGVNLANTTASQITVSAQLGTIYIVKDAPIPSGGALSVLEGKIIAEAADTIVVTSDTASSCDAIVSVLEQT